MITTKILDQLLRYFQAKIKEQILTTQNLYSFLETNDMIQHLGKGIDKVTYFDLRKDDKKSELNGIRCGTGIFPRFCESTVPLIYLVCKVEIPFVDIENFFKQKLSDKNFVDIYKTHFEKGTKVMIDQVEQFIAWGDMMFSPVEALEPFRSRGCLGEFYGFFNGGNQVKDLNEALKLLQSEYNPPYILLTSPNSTFKRESGMLNDIYDIYESPNFVNCNNEGGSCLFSLSIGKKKHKTFKLCEGYSFELAPKIHEKEEKLELLLMWSGRFVSQYDSAILYFKN